MALPQFQDSREHKLLLVRAAVKGSASRLKVSALVLRSCASSPSLTQAIVDAVEEGDIEKYQQVSVRPASKQRETCRIELFLFSIHVTRYPVLCFASRLSGRAGV